MTAVDVAKVPEALGQIAPGDTGAVTIEHRLDEQAVVASGGPRCAVPSGQQRLDASPLLLAQRVSSGHHPGTRSVPDGKISERNRSAAGSRPDWPHALAGIPEFIFASLHEL